MRFSYAATANQPDSLMPRLPFVLHYRARSVDVTGLLDTGSTVNIVPYQVGLALGAVWEECLTPVPLAGNLGRFAARALIVRGTQPQLLAHSPVRLDTIRRCASHLRADELLRLSFAEYFRWASKGARIDRRDLTRLLGAGQGTKTYAREISSSSLPPP